MASVRSGRSRRGRSLASFANFGAWRCGSSKKNGPRCRRLFSNIMPALTLTLTLNLTCTKHPGRMYVRLFRLNRHFNFRERVERFRKYQTDASCSTCARQRDLSYCRKTAITQLKLIGRTLAFNRSIEHTETFVGSARATLYMFWNSWKIFLKLRNAKFAVSGPNFRP